MRPQCALMAYLNAEQGFRPACRGPPRGPQRDPEDADDDRPTETVTTTKAEAFDPRIRTFEDIESGVFRRFRPREAVPGTRDRLKNTSRRKTGFGPVVQMPGGQRPEDIESPDLTGSSKFQPCRCNFFATQAPGCLDSFPGAGFSSWVVF